MSFSDMKSADDCLRQGLQQFARKQYKQAINLFNKVLEINGRAERQFSNLKEKTHIDEADFQNAEENKRIRQEQNFAAYYQRGLAFAVDNDKEQALKSFTKAIELKPDSSEVFFQRAKILEILRDYEEALNNYSRVIELDPHNFEAYLQRANCYCGHDAEKHKIEDLTKAIEIGPDFAEIYYLRARALEHIDKTNEANSRLDILKQVFEDLTKAIELKPDFVNAYYMRAGLFEEVGFFDNALFDYAKVIELEPDRKYAYRDRAEVFVKLGNIPQAIEQCTKLRTALPGSPCFCRHHADYSERTFPCRLCSCADFSEANMSNPTCTCSHRIDFHDFSRSNEMEPLNFNK
jgi:tetratricopeptide (TPR) repeat protein